MITNFELRPDGNIKVSPLTGYSTAIAAGMACLVRFEYAETDANLLANKMENLQLVLKPAQAVELARALSNMAETIFRQQQTDAPN